MPLRPPRLLPRPRSGVVHAAALAGGYTPLQAVVLAGRIGDAHAGRLRACVRPSDLDLDPYQLLPDIDRAAERLARAVVQGEPILPVSDHDVDGVSGHSLVREALIDVFGHPPDLVHSYTSHRLREGYGISEGVVDRIEAAGHRAGVVVSIDQGSSDEVRIGRLARLGIDTVVTDHHGVEGAGPASAYACVNPAREDGRFPDRAIAGCYTAWLTMRAVRDLLVADGHLSAQAPTLEHLHDFNALGTVADCVDLAASCNNRRIVQRGLELMNAGARPCWQAYRDAFDKHEPLTAADLGWGIGPLINARGRVDEAMTGVRFLRAPTLEAARHFLAQLRVCNEERKRIERELKHSALQLAERQLEAGAQGLALWLEDGHSGVHGVVSSRITEAHGCPTVCLSPKPGHPDLVTGSVRTIPGFHVRQALARIDAEAPGLLVAYGGHSGAGGLQVRRAHIPQFQALFDLVVRESALDLGPRILVDGPLPTPPALEQLQELAALAPYGRQFDPPVFLELATIEGAREVGQDGAHIKLDLQVQGKSVEGIWFNAAPEHRDVLASGGRRKVAFELDANTFRGRTRLQLLVRAIQFEDSSTAAAV